MEFDIVLIKMLLVVAIMLIVFLPNAAKAGLKSGSLDPIVQQLQTMGSCNLSYQAMNYSAGSGFTCQNIPQPSSRTQSSASRVLNTCFQPSSTRDTLDNYSVDISTSLTLTAGQSGIVFLEMSDDSGCSVNTQELSRAANGNTGTLAIGLNLVQNVTGALTGFVPAGKWIKLLSSNILNTPTFTYRSGQEVLM